MKRFLVAMTAVMLVAVLGTPAWAGSQDGAVIALHLQAHPLKGGDPCVMDALCCSDFVTEGDLFTSYDVYLVVAKGNPQPGVAALSCGIL